MIRLRQSVTVLLLAAASFGGSIGCEKESAAAGRQQDPRSRDVVPVTLAPTRIASVQRHVEVTGTLFGDEEATVSAKVPGRIVQVLLDVGDRTPAGGVLAQIDRTDYELSAAQKTMAMQASLAKLGLSEMPPEDFDLDNVPTVLRARLQTANAEARFNRGVKLFEQKPPLISEQDFADLKTAFAVARSNHQVETLTARSLLADARAAQSDLQLESQRLRDTTVRAPAEPLPATQSLAPRAGAGAERPARERERYAVAARLVSLGEYVREGTPLFRLVADDPIKFRAQVPEQFLAQVKVGQEASVQVASYPGERFSGAVARISPQVNHDTRTFEVEMLLPNPERKLQAGSFATGRILTRVDQNIPLVPLDALVTFAGVTKVFTVEDGKAVEKKIELGQRVGDHVEVISGLKGDEPVVLEGKNRLASGTPVTVSAAGK